MYFCSVHLKQYKHKGQTWKYLEGFLSKWKQGAVSPLCLELCPCLLVAVPERDHCCAYLTHRAAVQFQAIPVTSLQRAGGPVFPVQEARGSCTAASSWSGCKCTQTWNIDKSSPIRDSHNVGRSSECLPSHADRALHLELCCLTPFSYSNSLFTWLCISSLCSEGDKNPVTRRLLQSTRKVHPAAAPFHAKHDCVLRACAVGHSLVLI